MKRWLTLLTLVSSAAAHTAILGLNPAPHSRVTAPKMVTIKLNEAVPLQFATFKVYPLSASGNKLSVNRAAAALAKTALNAKNDASQRADLYAPAGGTANIINVPLKAGLKAGAYALLWRFLSEDGHVVSGQSVFYVQ